MESSLNLHEKGYPYEEEAHNYGLHADGEDHEHHHGRTSVMRKVKAKAKKIKDTIVQGHGHDPKHDQEYHVQHVPDDHDLDEEGDEMVDEPERYGTPAVSFESGTVRPSVPGQGERSGDHEPCDGRSTAMKDDRLGDSQARAADSLKSVSPEQEKDGLENTSVSITPRIVEQSKAVEPTETLTPRQEAIQEKPGISLDMPTGLEEDPHSPKNSPVDYTPSNYQTKVTGPTGAGVEEAEITPVLRSLDKMIISDESRPRQEEDILARPHDQFILPTGSHDQFSPELTLPIPITSDASQTKGHPNDDKSKASKQGSYTEKLSSATSAIANKAMSATNVVVSKLGYKEKGTTKEHEGEEQQKAKSTSSSALEYGKKIGATVTETLTPVYDKIAETGNTVMSKVPGIRCSIENKGGESDVKGQDKGVSVKNYVADKLRPGEEDRALSEVISEALHKQKQGITKKEDKPMGKVTESEEVKRRLGGSSNTEENMDESAASIPGVAAMVDKIKGVVGSMIGKGVETGQTHQSPAGTVTESASASREEESGERRLQESGN